MLYLFGASAVLRLDSRFLSSYQHLKITFFVTFSPACVGDICRYRFRNGARSPSESIGACLLDFFGEGRGRYFPRQDNVDDLVMTRS